MVSSLELSGRVAVASLAPDWPIPACRALTRLPWQHFTPAVTNSGSRGSSPWSHSHTVVKLCVGIPVPLKGVVGEHLQLDIKIKSGSLRHPPLLSGSKFCTFQMTLGVIVHYDSDFWAQQVTQDFTTMAHFSANSSNFVLLYWFGFFFSFLSPFLSCSHSITLFLCHRTAPWPWQLTSFSKMKGRVKSTNPANVKDLCLTTVSKTYGDWFPVDRTHSTSLIN